MLKLEKTSDHSGLMIRLREKEGFFEPRLLKALVIALVFHTSALLLFQVTPLNLFSTFTFSPIRVDSDQPLESLSTYVSTYFEEDELLLPPPINVTAALDWISPFPESTLISSHSIKMDAFQSIEEKLWPTWQIPLSLQLEEPSIRLIISGNLAEYPLQVSDPLLDQMKPFSSLQMPKYVTYQVQVDHQTGEIFWYERIQSSEKAEIDRTTEKILLNLRFMIPELEGFIQGNLDFVVLTDES